MQKHQKAPHASAMRKSCEKTLILMQMAMSKVSLSNFMYVTPL